MNKPKFRAWDERSEKLYEVLTIDFIKKVICVIESEKNKICRWIKFNDVILVQYTEMHDEESLTDIWEHDLLEIESPKGKFIAKVEKCFGTFGIVAVKGEIVDYFTDHWCDSFMPLIDLYWNESGDDGCLPKSKRLGSIHENPELLSEASK